MGAEESEEAGEADDEGAAEEDDEVEVDAATANCFCFSAAASIVSINETILSPEIKMQQHSKICRCGGFPLFCVFVFVIFLHLLFAFSYREFFQHFLRLFVAVVVVVLGYLSLLLFIFVIILENYALCACIASWLRLYW